jgi:TPR repeat protein
VVGYVTLQTGMTPKPYLLLVLTAALACLPAVVRAAPAESALRPDPQALAVIKAKAEKGDPASQYAYGHAFLHGTNGQAIDPAQGVLWLTKAVDGGSGGAAFELARLYDDGKSVPKDVVLAMTFYQKASDRGIPAVQEYVCQAKAGAANSAEDWAQALPYCQKASAQGSVEANHVLGIAYLDGRGIPQDTAQGVQFLQRAAAKGSLPAMTRLAGLYSEGGLVPQDHDKAFTWHRQAARYGSVPSILAMARQYEAGLGTEANLDEAARLYEILARHGSVEAAEWFTAHPDVSRNRIVSNIITPDKIPSGLILYAVASHDPRFTTLDMQAYVRQMSLDIYPMKAQETQMEGMATAECRIRPDGTFKDCIVVDESPPGYGFGPSILRMTDALQNSGNKSAWTGRYAGKVLRVTTRWKVPDPVLYR